MPTLDNLRKTARRWLRALRAGDADARARLLRAYPSAPEHPTLRDVQHGLARERGHESWIALTKATADARAAATPLTTLLDAAARGDARAVAAILDEHPGVINTRGRLAGHTGLRTALHFGVHHDAVVRTLLDRGADPNVRDEGDNAYPIHFAAERGELPVVRLLIEHGADPVGAGTVHELDVLGWAVCFDNATHVEVARYLLAHGARYTILSAAALGEPGAIRELAQSGADVNQRMDRTNHRRTPLHLAIVKKQPGAIAALIELGADLDAEDAVGLTPLDQAALLGERGLAKLLVDGGATMTLPAAIALEQPEQVERIVRENPEIMSGTANRRWARLVVHASSRAPGRVLEALLRTAMRHRAGLAIVNMEDDAETAVDQAEGYTPLHAAAFAGNNEAVAVLLKHGANPRARDGRYRGTPAGWARYAGHTATADLILDADVDLFDAIDADRADRVGQILDRDPDAIDRPFKAYASCGTEEAQWWPAPDCAPLEWAMTSQKANALRVLTERGRATRTRDDAARADRLVTFLQSACWDGEIHGKAAHAMHDRAAQRLFIQDASLARDSIYTAVVAGDLDHVEQILAGRPELAGERGGARGWTPILYLSYTRFTHPATIENAVRIATRLLDHGANPNDFYMAGDARYTALVGAAGEGEQDSPRQPYAAALFDLLLERGAEPYDIQVLYNTHFSGDMLWWLELVHARTVHTPRAVAWTDPDWPMFDMGAYGSGARFILETAIKKRNLALAEWAVAHGANPNPAPARDRRFSQRSLYEFAILEQVPEMAELLARCGAPRSEPGLSDQERFRDLCFREDREAARAFLRAHPECLQSPHVLFDAAARDRPDVLAVLRDLGFSFDLRDSTGRRPLHEAAANNALGAASVLVAGGAEIDPRESVYHATPIGWAAHGGKADVLAFLSEYSRDIWTLCFNGFVDRVREILREDPGLARLAKEDGTTPLWWLPDDEDQAMELVDLLWRAGADPAARSKGGTTAADWARHRGMTAVALRLERAAAGVPGSRSASSSSHPA